MPRQEYQRPPVQEVILDVQTSGELDSREVIAIGHELAGAFPEANVTPLAEPGLRISLGPNAPGTNLGWQFEQAPSWVLRIKVQGFSLHFARPGPWPDGPYLGWPSIRQTYESLHPTLRPSYDHLPIRRAGLRYLNRIAIPRETDLDDWFAIRIEAPDLLRDPFAFQLRKTWALAGAHDGWSATIGLATIEIENERLSANHLGILLDIDIFNLKVRHAPPHDDVLAWFDRAHEIENALFEECITPRLRATFDEVADETHR